MKYILGSLAFILVLTSCGAVSDVGTPTPGNGKGREGWWTTPVDSEGNRYECLYWSLDQSTAMWCKPDPVTP